MKDGDAIHRKDLWRWASLECKYCHGSGRVRLVDGGEKVCECARRRILEGRKPKPSQNKMSQGPQENKGG